MLESTTRPPHHQHRRNKLYPYRWDEPIKLPVKYSALPADACLALTVYACERPGSVTPVAGTTVPLFSQHGYATHRTGFEPQLLLHVPIVNGHERKLEVEKSKI